MQDDSDQQQAHLALPLPHHGLLLPNFPQGSDSHLAPWMAFNGHVQQARPDLNRNLL